MTHPARFLALCALLSASQLHAAPDEVSKAHRTGWEFSGVAVSLLRKGELKEFPGTTAWLEDYGRIEADAAGIKKDAPFPAIDVDALVTSNPNFWRMVYEIAPGDPALALLHSSLLLAGGEAQRALQLSVLARQRPGVDPIMTQALASISLSATDAQRRSNELVEAGIKLHDAADFTAALAKYDEALALLPANGWAFYERGFSLRAQALKAAGQSLPANDSVTIGHAIDLPEPVVAAFTQARAHDPFQWQAWQGNDPEIVNGARALFVKAQPVWDEIRRDAAKPVEDPKFLALLEGCERAHIDDYALFLRQIVVARRGAYRPADQGPIADSLRRLISGPTIDDVIKKLSSDAGFPIRRLAPIEEEK